MSTTTNADDRRTDRTTTRAEHHADSDADAVRTAKEQLAWILARRDCRAWAISSQALADATGDDGIAATTVRDAIRELRRERDLPIVSCSRGYYLIDDTDALQRELDRIQSEIETREATKRELTAAFNRYDGGDP